MKRLMAVARYECQMFEYPNGPTVVLYAGELTSGVDVKEFINGIRVWADRLEENFELKPKPRKWWWRK